MTDMGLILAVIAYFVCKVITDSMRAKEEMCMLEKYLKITFKECEKFYKKMLKDISNLEG